MNFKPGDILYRRYSDNNDLYCIISVFKSKFSPEHNRIALFPYYSGRGENYLTESEESASNWFIPVDLNNYPIKDKFLKKIKEYLNDNLGKPIAYHILLDNLIYIEILAELKKYQKSDIVEGEE